MLQEHPEAGMCYCKTSIFSQLPLNGNEPTRKRNDEEFTQFLPIIFRGRPWSTSSCLWTRNASEMIGQWMDAWTWEDVEYDCRAGCKDITVLFLPESLCYKREDKGNYQLSHVGSHKETMQKIAPIHVMTESLISTGKIKNKRIRERFYNSVLKKNLIILMNFDEFEKADEICDDIQRISNIFSKEWTIASLIRMVNAIDTRKLILPYFWRFTAYSKSESLRTP
jgi:hypothetical protein